MLAIRVKIWNFHHFFNFLEILWTSMKAITNIDSSKKNQAAWRMLVIVYSLLTSQG